MSGLIVSAIPNPARAIEVNYRAVLSALSGVFGPDVRGPSSSVARADSLSLYWADDVVARVQRVSKIPKRNRIYVTGQDGGLEDSYFTTRRTDP
jgi:hypothetical protein